MTADKICEYTAKHGDSSCYVPIGDSEGFLHTAYNNREFLIQVFTLWVERIRFSLINVTVSGDAVTDGIHIVLAGITDQTVHEQAGHSDKNRGHQSNAPLQRQTFHCFSSMTYPSPMRLCIGSYPKAVRSFFLRAEMCTRIELLKLSTLLSQTCSRSSS